MGVDNEQSGYFFTIRKDEDISCGAALLKKVSEATFFIRCKHDSPRAVCNIFNVFRPSIYKMYYKSVYNILLRKNRVNR